MKITARTAAFVASLTCLLFPASANADQGCETHPSVAELGFEDWVRSREQVLVIRVLGGELRHPVGIYERLPRH